MRSKLIGLKREEKLSDMFENIKEKLVYITLFGCFIYTALLTGLNYTTQRKLEQYMELCEQYRVELDAASNRQRDITENVERTREVLSKTVYTVGELRAQLKEVESSYNYMWGLLHNNDSSLSNREE